MPCDVSALQGRWCKGETSGHFIKVARVFADCDRDSLVYLSEPIGPACHTVQRSFSCDESRWITATMYPFCHLRSQQSSQWFLLLRLQGAPSCWFSETGLDDGRVRESGDQHSRASAPLPTLLELERTIQSRREAAEAAGGEGLYSDSALVVTRRITRAPMRAAPDRMTMRMVQLCKYSLVRCRRILLLDSQASCQPGAPLQEGAQICQTDSLICISAFQQFGHQLDGSPAAPIREVAVRRVSWVFTDRTNRCGKRLVSCVRRWRRTRGGSAWPQRRRTCCTMQWSCSTPRSARIAVKSTSTLLQPICRII
jgi:Phosphoribosyl-AMP cyclohydrolase